MNSAFPAVCKPYSSIIPSNNTTSTIHWILLARSYLDNAFNELPLFSAGITRRYFMPRSHSIYLYITFSLTNANNPPHFMIIIVVEFCSLGSNLKRKNNTLYLLSATISCSETIVPIFTVIVA